MVPRNSTFCFYSSYVGDSYCALLGNINSSQCVVDQVAVKGSHPIIIFRTINWWKTAIIHYCCMTPPVPVRARSDRWSTMSFIQTSSSLISRRDQLSRFRIDLIKFEIGTPSNRLYAGRVYSSSFVGPGRILHRLPGVGLP